MKSKKTKTKISYAKIQSMVKLYSLRLWEWIKQYSLVTWRFLVLYRKKIFTYLLIVVLAILTFTFALNLFYTTRLDKYVKNISDIESLDPRYSALILGAGLTENGSPSAILKDRLDTGVILLKTQKVKRLILSGDNRTADYNEPQAMINYLVKQGISPSVLVADYAGRRTYDSCYRAKEIFGQDKIFVITQDFHITRSVFLCKSVGIDTIGIVADKQSYPDALWNDIRDYFGLIGAFWDAKVWKPTPVLGEKIPI